MRDARICVACGEKYSYCPHCRGSKPEDQWKYVYHDEKCMKIVDIFHLYRGNQLSKEEARSQMESIKPNIDNVLKNNSLTATEIKKIFDIEEKSEETDKVENELKKLNSAVLEESKSEVAEVKINKKRPSKKEIAESE